MDSRLDEWTPRVYRLALRLSNDPHVAEDLTQETLLRAWRQVHSLREPAALRVWLFRITTNLWRDRLRRRSPTAQLDHDPPGPTAEPGRSLSGGEELSRAYRAMCELPPRQREVLHLIACEEMSLADVAATLGITRESAKANLSLARKRLRSILEPEPASRP